MGEEGKKISFGFSKLIKKTQIVSSTPNPPKNEKSNVELIDCFEEKAIKLKNPVQPKEKLLIIPLQRNQDNLAISTKQADFDCLTSAPSSQNNTNSIVKSKLSNTDTIKDTSDAIPSEFKSTSALTLDEIAAKEILQDLNNKKDEDECRVFTVPLTNNPPSGENESTLDDYENIPVGDFGLAMLRGMGWCPGKGIGKNEKLFTPSLPTLRPKGMGLGADKVLKSSNEPKASNEDLKMVKNSFVRVLAGQYKSLYGQIEGFDDETGRLIVKLALKDVSVSLNEFMVQLVDKSEFLKNSKVINVSKYEQYKDEENKGNSDQHREDDPKRNALKKSAKDFPKQLKQSHHKVKIKSLEKDHTHRETDKKTNDKYSRELMKHTTQRRSRSRSRSLSRGTELKERKSSLENKFDSKKQGSRTLDSRRGKKHCSFKRSSSSSSSTSLKDSFRQDEKLSQNINKHAASDKMSYQKKKYVSEKRSRSSSNSSSSGSSRDCMKKRDFRTYKKKSSSKKSKGRHRSRSPRKHSSSKKHKNRHRDRS